MENDKIKNILYKNYSNIIELNKDDYYIPHIDLYVSDKTDWIHGGCAFNPRNKDHIKKLNVWKNLASQKDTYKKIINKWSIEDVEYRNNMLKNNMLYIEVYDEDITEDKLLHDINNVINGIHLSYTDEELLKEYEYYCTTKGNVNSSPSKNKLIKQFQKNFYKEENNIFKNNPVLRRKLIENRIKYLFKKEFDITNEELLRGFKICGIHYGYSHFNPLWFKYFIEKYNVSSVYDCCGGWGHRLIGALSSNINYIYNDLSHTTFECSKKLYNYLKGNNVIFYNNDANYFVPSEKFDSMFTCPPYYNLEKYECGGYKDMEEYKNFLYNICNIFLSSSAYLMGIVLKESYGNIIENYLKNNNTTLIEKQSLKVNKSHFSLYDNLKKEKEIEYLYIFKK